MRPDLFTISRSGPGTLSTMARPRGGDWLVDEVRGLADFGVAVLVSLLTGTEATELGLTAEPEEARSAGLAFYQLPTPDRHVPDQAASIILAATLRKHLGDGQHVAIHCRNGIGRCSTLAAIILIQEGTEPDQAWNLITTARGLAVPDTPDQRAAADYGLQGHRRSNLSL
jgi:protein-tyrosine phosphatase